jgi:hypothetical protein
VDHPEQVLCQSQKHSAVEFIHPPNWPYNRDQGRGKTADSGISLQIEVKIAVGMLVPSGSFPVQFHDEC